MIGLMKRRFDAMSRWKHMVPALALAVMAVIHSCGRYGDIYQNCSSGSETEPAAEVEMAKTNEEWKEELSPDIYRVMREKGTERPFTGEYCKHKEEGKYYCAACGNPLFGSETKFESGTGWPSFYAPLSEEAVEREKDQSHGMVRTEVHCARCGGHLGHVFEDGPEPTGLRYCVNSVSLRFGKEESAGSDDDSLESGSKAAETGD